MAELNELLESIHKITKKNIAVVSKHEVQKQPVGMEFEIGYDAASTAEGSNYKGFNIYKLEHGIEAIFVCVQADAYIKSETAELVLLGIKSALSDSSPDIKLARKLLDGSLHNSSLFEIPDRLRKQLAGNIVMIEGCNELYTEAVEILVNTADVRICFDMSDKIFAVLGDTDIEEVCEELYNNIVSELFMECSIAVGGMCSDIGELKQLYENSLEALLLKKQFRLKQHVLVYENIFGYRIASGLSERLKADIVCRVFTHEFRELVNSEMTVTIEEFFSNNLNLTDTAAKLYVHRNTLLYRLEKIYKATGYDLKKFEDSWFFRLAWLINKEQQK